MRAINDVSLMAGLQTPLSINFTNISFSDEFWVLSPMAAEAKPLFFIFLFNRCCLRLQQLKDIQFGLAVAIIFLDYFPLSVLMECFCFLSLSSRSYENTKK